MLNQVGSTLDVAELAFVVPCMPPSLPSSRMLDDPGTNARACWSVWTGPALPPKLYPHVRSLKEVPVRVANQTSKVLMKTRSALLGSTATAWSYQFCG